MKSEKGVTLSALVAYITIFTIILAIMANISAYFYRNVGQIKDSPTYIAEFNKFSMFFVTDVKRNTKVNIVTSNSLEFADGTKYTYKNNSIYRNDEKIAKHVKSFAFTESNYTQNAFTKKIINVKTTLGNGNEQITRNIDFVLRYW